METPTRSHRCARRASALRLSLLARHAAVVAMLTLAGVGCGSSSGPSSTSTTTTTSAPASTTTSVQGLTASFTVQNTPCVAPQVGPVSCAFAASATGGNGTYTYAWTFAGPLSTTSASGQSIKPDLGCGLSAGTALFNLNVTLVVTSNGAQTTSGPTLVQIARDKGNCGV